jgi:MFS family permease
MNATPRSTRARRTLGRRASFWVSAAVVAHTLWTSAAPAVTYPLYAALWHLTPTVTTAMFAVYPVMVVLTLLLFGNLSDQVGRRAMILAGVGASLLGVALFAVAPGVAWVFAGRALMGVGVGLSTGPATAALVEFSLPGGQGRANVVATAATALGLGLATLLGGALIQYAPLPLHLNFIVLAAVLAVLLALAWFLPRPTALARAEAARWRPGAVVVPRDIARVFATSATAVTAGYAMGALMLSLGTQIARDLIGSGNALVNGAALALFALVTGSTALVARRLPGSVAIVSGGVVAAAALALLMLSAQQQALPIFLVAAAGAGAGYSLLFLGGLTLINARAPAHHRAGTLSAIYLIGYLLMGAIALSLGVAATHWGLRTAIDLGAPVIAALGLAAAVLAGLGATPPAGNVTATPRPQARPRRTVGAET